MAQTRRALAPGYALITGGAGFIATNLVERLVRDGERVVLLDNFSRAGVEANARFSTRIGGGAVRVVRGDCRDRELVDDLVRSANQVFHFAAQVAVTTSLTDPWHDFDVNARGTLTVLEAVRRSGRRLPLLFTSTNKTYGALPWLELRRADHGYEPIDSELRRNGVSERAPLDFHSPYGCSKGAADQYVLDYARSFGLDAIVFRMSCIYGQHQCGNEDQGWVAHFVKSVLAGEPLTIYGDGFQVRDLLFATDLVEALLLARDHSRELAGQAFNIGGGAGNAVSLREVLERTAQLCGRKIELRYEPTRVGDQRYYVSDVRRFQEATGWSPTVAVPEGLRRLHTWFSRDQLESRSADARLPEAARSPAAHRVEGP
jgi:CDP-paratose 2-epimerase